MQFVQEVLTLESEEILSIARAAAHEVWDSKTRLCHVFLGLLNYDHGFRFPKLKEKFESYIGTRDNLSPGKTRIESALWKNGITPGLIEELTVKNTPIEELSLAEAKSLRPKLSTNGPPPLSWEVGRVLKQLALRGSPITPERLLEASLGSSSCFIGKLFGNDIALRQKLIPRILLNAGIKAHPLHPRLGQLRSEALFLLKEQGNPTLRLRGNADGGFCLCHLAAEQGVSLMHVDSPNGRRLDIHARELPLATADGSHLRNIRYAAAKGVRLGELRQAMGEFCKGRPWFDLVPVPLLEPLAVSVLSRN